MEGTTRSKKRARKETTSPDGASDRRRGRPRVDRQDESAADRRRTQIRVAQRAYRQRKEGTLEDLRKRVSNLTTTVALMNKAFTEFKDGFQALDLTPAQASRLDDVSAQIDSLAKGSCDGVNCTLSPPDGRRVSTSETSTGPGISDSITKVRNVPSWLDESALLSELTKPKRSREDLAMGWDINAFGILNGRNDMHDVDFLMKDASTNIDYQTGPGIRTPGLPRPRSKTGSNMVPLVTQPTAPRSFASQETTFARRLYRSCIEKGYSLLLNPEAQAITYDRVFRLSLFGRSRSKIISSMRNLLAKGPQHDPIFGETAAIHIGGAGTHYPRKDVYGNILPKKPSRHVGLVNPQTLSLLDNAASDITVEVAGFEGEWFDTQDVQGYLEEKGIFIDPSASYVEADVPLDQHQIPSSTSTMSSATASDTPDSTGGIYNFAEPEIGAPQLDDFLAGSGLASVGFSDAQTGSFFNFLRPGETIKTPGAANSQPLTWPRNHEDDFMNTSSLSLISSDAISLPRKKKVVIDVQALIDVLAVNGICLGRSPGFRRHHVDSALTTASLEVC